MTHQTSPLKFATVVIATVILPLATALAEPQKVSRKRHDPDQLAPIEQELRRDLAAKHRYGKEDLYGARWFVAGTEFGRLFIAPDGGLNLLDWIGSSGLDLTPDTESYQRVPEFVLGEKTFRDENMNLVTLSIYVPHPKFEEVVTLGLVQQIAALTPSKTKIHSSEEIQLQGVTKATLYVLESGECSILAKGARGSVINLKSKTFRDKESLIKAAKQLDIERLNMKLNS